MGSERLTALTDGLIAVVITIMVLELKPPHGADLESLAELWPTFLSFALSFIYVAIYWNNHHHFFKLVPHVNGAVMWANLNLLFWLSLIPFTTAWMDEHNLSPVPVAVYGGSLLCTALSWYLMQATIVGMQGSESSLRLALGRDLKGKMSPLLYLAGMLLAFVTPLASYAVYVGVAVVWLIPDRRMEAALREPAVLKRKADEGSAS
ncbi:TMEM175 family protein [Rhodopila sp.]|uniref:TMEM175 family protein n=1 Tax=Rhodopila sp. TaxID=2480087 RepID=UPI003D135FBA